MSSSVFTALKRPFTVSLQDTTWFQRLAMSYRALRERDQWALKILGVFLALVLIYTAIISPAQNYAYKSRDAAGRNDHTLQWMQANRAAVEQPGNSSGTRLDGQTLLAAASSAAKDNGLSFKRYEPVDESSVRVWLENVDFNATVHWIEALHKNVGIAVRELQLDRVAGAVNLNLVLQVE